MSISIFFFNFCFYWLTWQYSIIQLKANRLWERLAKITTDRHLQVPKLLKDNNHFFIVLWKDYGHQIQDCGVSPTGVVCRLFELLASGDLFYLFQVQDTIPVFPPPYLPLPEVSSLYGHAIQSQQLLNFLSDSGAAQGQVWATQKTTDAPPPLQWASYISSAWTSKIASSIWLLQNVRSPI